MGVMEEMEVGEMMGEGGIFKVMVVGRRGEIGGGGSEMRL